ncbi:NRDE family protein [Hyalangium rubrum]|uniref:NRDE family protein n=1 Tax=Hyalangium rubrum TaxID=3103134 RepID=A0ABU5H672_9BACT|nr:NRDE family protein [Hyalangium sp. s54d21]MDY7228343.1 NRDE family protein [Hyalangium sp. s54d21]
MCTAIFVFRPGEAWPLLCCGTRDEVRTRPWRPPGAWWPAQSPRVVGGLDEQAGGTWLAVDPRSARAAVVLNRSEPTGAEASLSRGRLPLWAVSQPDFSLSTAEAELFPPFNLLLMSPTRCSWWRWDGTGLRSRSLGPGTYILTSADLNDTEASPRHRRWLPRFVEAELPEPSREDFLGAWGGWPELLADPHSPFDDWTALNVKGFSHLPGYGTSSAALVALSAQGTARYDFCQGPPHSGTWRRVL